MSPTDQMTLTDLDKATLFEPLPGSGVEPVTDLVDGVAFHPAVARWFTRRFEHGPTPPQRNGWPSIAARQHTLIAAPTGSGKTLAGFLVAINDLYLAHAGGQDVSRQAQVVYVSPLKALAVDIAENLEQPLIEIADIATEMGLAAPDLRIGVRTGDTTASARAAMVKKPPAFVVTTPESLYLLLTAQKSRETLRSVHTVIVDEIHALARDKRGSHLTLTLERLAHVAAVEPMRIGLSATQKPIETVAKLLVGTRRRHDGTPECVIVDGGHQRDLDLAIEVPEAELEAIASGGQMADILDRIAAHVVDHHTTLVFVNTRRLAERLAHELGERLGDEVVAAHHGSLSKDRRHRVERQLRAGELKALVATASLELGIDIGPVELVCQIGSPRSIATFLQRVGRSNHSRYGTPKGRLYPLTRDELVESVGLMAAIHAGRLDALQPPDAPLDILAQQVVAETAADEWRTEDLFELVRRAAPYASLTREQFDEVVELTANGVQTGRGRRAAYVHHDGVNGELRGRKGARLAALTSGGAIPEIGDLRVVAEPEETFIGTVNEDWATESMAGDVFLLGTHAWQIRQVVGGVVRVVDAGDKHPTIPFWTGEAPARTVELSEEVSRLRAAVDTYVVADDLAGATRFIADTAGITPAIAAFVATYLGAGRAILGVMPTQSDLVIERFFDESGGMQLVIHSPWGARINRAMGYALRKKFCRSFNFELQAAASDDATVISLGPHHSFPLDDVPRFLTPAIIPETLTQAVLDQPLFQSRWRWNLNRALLVLRWRSGKRNPPPIQRMEADDFMAALFPQAAACQENVTGPIEVPDHPIVRQTIHDSLTESLDVDGLVDLWRKLDSGDVRFHFRDTTEPSLLAHEILTAKPYAFLDDGEAVDRRTNAVPLRRGLPVRPAELGQLDAEAVAQVRDEITPHPTSSDELHDLLALLVLTRPRPEWAELFDQLAARGRVQTVGEGSERRWHTTEAAAEVAVLSSGQADARRFPEKVAAEVLRGHLDLHSPATADQLGDITGLTQTNVAVGLAQLETEGFALQGHFQDLDTDSVEWCSRRLLARMHSYSRRRRRGSVEPASAQDFVRFLLRWQHLAPGSQLAGPQGLARAVEKLQGWHAATAAWEPDLLARRVNGYQRSWLDQLCYDGQVMWARLAPPARPKPEAAPTAASKATPVSVAFRADMEWLLEAARGVGNDAVPEVGALAEVVASLGSHGARFVTELAAETGRLTSDIERALWAGVSAGLITADGFAPIRALGDTRRRAPRNDRGLSRLRRGGAVARSTAGAGRWNLLPTVEAADDRDAFVEAVAEQLLLRWGVVFYDLVAHEGLALPWRDLQWALRRFEDRGLVKGGRFVAGFSGEQFALPEAADGLRAIRKVAKDGQPVTVSACDPCNVTGVLLPGDRVPGVRTNTVTFVDGLVAG